MLVVVLCVNGEWPFEGGVCHEQHTRRDAMRSHGPFARSMTMTLLDPLHRCLDAPLLHINPNPFLQQPSQKTFRTKRTLAKKANQNRPIPYWIRLRTGNTIRCVASYACLVYADSGGINLNPMGGCVSCMAC